MDTRLPTRTLIVIAALFVASCDSADLTNVQPQKSAPPAPIAPSAAVVPVSGSHTGIYHVTSTSSLTGDADFDNLYIDAGATLNVHGYHLTVNQLFVSGSIIMRDDDGLITAGLIDVGNTTGNYADSTLISAGTIRVVGSGNTGEVLRTSGSNHIVLAGHDQQFGMTSVANVDVEADSVTIGGTEQVIPGTFAVRVNHNLTLMAGVLHGGASVHGTITTYAGTRLDMGYVEAYKPLAAAGDFIVAGMNFRLGVPYVIPTASNFHYADVTISNATAARLTGNLNTTGQFLITQNGSLDVRGFAVTALRFITYIDGGGSLIMKDRLGALTAGTVYLGAQNAADSTLLRAGTITVTAEGGNIPRSSGNHKVVLAGTEHQQFSAYRIANLDIDNPASVSVGDTMLVKGRVNVLRGTVDGIMRIDGSLVTSAGTTVTAGVDLRGTYSAAGTFNPGVLWLRSGGITTIHGGSNYHYQEIDIESGTAARLLGNVDVAGYLRLSGGASVDLRGDTLHVGDQFVGGDGALIMQHSTAMLDANVLVTGWLNETDSTLLSAGTIQVHSSSHVGSTSGSNRILIGGSTSLGLSGGNLQNVIVSNTATTTLVVPWVKAHLTLLAGTLQINGTTDVGTLVLRASTTLDSSVGHIIYHDAYQRHGATIIGTAPTAATP